MNLFTYIFSYIADIQYICGVKSNEHYIMNILNFMQCFPDEASCIAYQFETGAFSTGYMKDGSPFYDQSDEVEAYARGTLFGGQSRSASSIASDPHYGTIQATPMDATKIPAVILNNPTALQKYANNTRSIFRVNGITYKMRIIP
ncbi:hypothetical protein [Bacteroides sp. UBA939]|uniref:hypothetical protein n=1 Tax=Bacteroides sp. UBA939 TaxID=1946092 RepID=UPI0025C1D7BC|nr:hypothetical protein [Bacteroides sp. UBA939]